LCGFSSLAGASVPRVFQISLGAVEPNCSRSVVGTRDYFVGLPKLGLVGSLFFFFYVKSIVGYEAHDWDIKGKRAGEK